MFKISENKLLKEENENLKNQLKLKEVENKQLEEQYIHKCNELDDLIAESFMSFKKILELAERNDYNNSQQKIAQIKECAEDYKDHFARMTLNSVKNRTTATDNN